MVLTEIPSGWFLVGHTADLTAGSVRPVRYFGRDLALWVDHQGVAHLVDAHCPHQGAHLGSGRVVDDCIVCPFHAFSFDGEGRLAGAGRPVTRTYELAVRSGRVFAWWHPEAQPSTWELPEGELDPPPGYVPAGRETFEVASSWLEVNENAYDLDHLGHVHSHVGTADVVEQRTEGHYLRCVLEHHFGLGNAERLQTDHESWGPGCMRFHSVGELNWCLYPLTTPIDADRLALDYELWIAPDLDVTVHGRVLRKMFRQGIAEDQRIWETKIFRPEPLIGKLGSTVRAYRAWAAQFMTTNGAPQ